MIDINNCQDQEDYGGKSMKNHGMDQNHSIFMHRPPVKTGKPTSPTKKLQQQISKSIGVKTYKS
jgi:hypothetical protein